MITCEQIRNSSDVSIYAGMKFAFSCGSNVKDNNPRSFSSSLASTFNQFYSVSVRGALGLDEYLAADKATRDAQKDGNWFNAATFSEGRTEDNVTSISGFIIDIDTGNVTEAMIQQLLHDLVYIAYTSYSNHPNKPRWRVFIPYKEPASVELHRRAYTHFQNLFNGQLDQKCRLANQVWFLPAVPPGGEQYYSCFSNGILKGVAGVKLFDPTTLPGIVKQTLPAVLAATPVASNDPFNIEKTAGEGERFSQLNAYVWKLLNEIKPLGEVWSLLGEYNQTHCNPPHGTTELRRVFNNCVDSFKRKHPDSYKQMEAKSKVLPPPPVYSLADIHKMTLPETKWAVDGLIPEGLTILAGDPKIGKSWFCFGLCIAIGLGLKAFGEIDVEQGDVYYLALEDNHNRMKNRLNVLLKSYGLSDFNSEAISVTYRFNPLDQGGYEQLSDHLQQNPNTRLVVIDTLVKIQPASSKRNSYADDYLAVSSLKALAEKFRVPIVVVHHLRKQQSEDPFKQITGTTGLSGAADSMIVLDRGRSKREAILRITGRDVEEQNIAFEFGEQHPGMWLMKGEADTDAWALSPTRRDILEVMDNVTPLSPVEIWKLVEAKGLPHSRHTVREQLSKMLKAGTVEQPSSGHYILPTTGECPDQQAHPDEAQANQAHVVDQPEEEKPLESAGSPPYLDLSTYSF